MQPEQTVNDLDFTHFLNSLFPSLPKASLGGLSSKLYVSGFPRVLYSRVLGTSMGFFGGPTDRVGDSFKFFVRLWHAFSHKGKAWYVPIKSWRKNSTNRLRASFHDLQMMLPTIVTCYVILYQHCMNGLTEYGQPANMDQNQAVVRWLWLVSFVIIVNEHKIVTTDNHNVAFCWGLTGVSTFPAVVTWFQSVLLKVLPCTDICNQQMS